jgi:hypothetical protein
LLTEYNSWATSNGTLDLQSASLATPSGGYAFFLNLDQQPLAIGGVVKVDNSGGAGGISGAGCVFDINDLGTSYINQLLTSPSIVSAPDQFGLVTFNLYSTGALQNSKSEPGISLIGYMLDNTHIRLVENQNVDYLGLPMGGTALGQTGTGTFRTSSLSGSSDVISTPGVDFNGTVQVAGLLTFNADGSVSGNFSLNDFAVQTPQGGSTLAAEVGSATCASGTAVTPCYTIDASGIGGDGGTGRVTITNITDSTAAPIFNYNLQLYLDGNGNAFVLSLDDSDVLAGLSCKQTAGAGTLNAGSFRGAYATSATGVSVSSKFEFEAVGPVALTESEHSRGTLI